MNTELNHEQAAVLRAVHNHTVIYIGAPVMGDWDASAYIEDYCGSAPAELTPAGQQALARYDREYVTVRRDDLELAFSHFNTNIIYAATVAEIPTRDAEVVRDRLRAALEKK